MKNLLLKISIFYIDFNDDFSILSHSVYMVENIKKRLKSEKVLCLKYLCIY